MRRLIAVVMDINDTFDAEQSRVKGSMSVDCIEMYEPFALENCKSTTFVKGMLPLPSASLPAGTHLYA